MTPEEEVTTLTGYHGTNLDLVPIIDKESLKISKGRGHWFGNGCYFFIDGINTVSVDRIAEKWAINESWNSESGSYDYSNWVVLECVFPISPKEILDITQYEGLKLFNEFRDALLDKLFQANKKIKKTEYQDSDVFDIMKQNLTLKVILGNVFLKYGELRKLGTGVNSRIPNVTMFCVQEKESDYVFPSRMKIIKKGEISWI